MARFETDRWLEELLFFTAIPRARKLVAELHAELLVEEMAFEHQAVRPLVSLEPQCVFDGPERIPLVHIRELHHLNALVLLQAVVTLQTDREAVLRVVLRRQRDLDVANADEVLLFDLLARVAIRLRRREARDVVTERCSVEGKLRVKDFLILVDRVHLDSLFHKLAAVLDHLAVQVFLLPLQVILHDFDLNVANSLLVLPLLLGQLLAVHLSSLLLRFCPLLGGGGLLRLYFAKIAHFFMQVIEVALVLLVDDQARDSERIINHFS